MMKNNELIMKALGICHTLTYNEEPEGSAKHIIRELAHRLETESRRTIDCDQVAWMLNAIGRYLPQDNNPRISRKRDVQVYGLLYEIMEVAGLKFEDDAAARNGTPTDVQTLRVKPTGPEAAQPQAAESAVQGGSMRGIGT